jgi:hypothetical protein
MASYASKQVIKLSDTFNTTSCFIQKSALLISNFRRVLYVVCFLLGNSLASKFYMPTVRNTLWRWNRQSVPKRQHIKFIHRGITQKKTYKNSASLLMKSANHEYKNTNLSMESWIPYTSWNLKVHYHIHNSLQLVPILCHINPLQVLLSIFVWPTLISFSYL